MYAAPDSTKIFSVALRGKSLPTPAVDDHKKRKIQQRSDNNNPLQ